MTTSELNADVTTPQRRPGHEVCPSCDAAVNTGARFCTHCGATLEELPEVAGSDTLAVSQDVTTALERDVGQDPPSAQATTVMKPVQAPRIAPADGDLNRCPSCGGPNSPQRELCGRCGADLETGVVPPRPAPRPLPVTPEPARSSVRRRRGLWIPVVAVVGVVAAIVATLWLARLGPFALEPSVPVAVFDAGRYEGEPDAVVLSDIATATTRPPEGDRTFTAAQMVDADPTTAWHSDPDSLPEGVGETIDLFLAEPAWIDQLVINNGDHADPDAYAATSRILRAQMTLDGGRAFEINLLDQGRQPQSIALPGPELTTTVRIEILATVPGDHRADLAVSDVELSGWLADASDADLAEQRADVRRAAGPVQLEN